MSDITAGDWKTANLLVYRTVIGHEDYAVQLVNYLKVHKIENFFDSDFGICVISLLIMSKY